MGKMWVSFNVRENLLKDFGTGKTFKATVPALGNKEITLRTYYMKDGKLRSMEGNKSNRCL